MKRWITGFLVCLLLLAALVWFVPAGWALPLLQPALRGVRFDGVGGTLWQGDAQQVWLADGTPLGHLDWTLSRRALLGDMRGTFALRQPQWNLSGAVQRVSAGELQFADISLHMDMTLLGAQPWLHGEPQGHLDLQAPTAELEGNWPMQLDATGTWSKAVVRTADGDVSLGTLSLAANGQSGVMQATLNDDGNSAVQTAGRLSFSPLGWDLQLRLVPRSDDPAVRPWLLSLGTPAADGTLELRYRGGLAQLSPATTKP